MYNVGCTHLLFFVLSFLFLEWEMRIAPSEKKIVIFVALHSDVVCPMYFKPEDIKNIAEDPQVYCPAVRCMFTWR